MIGTMVVKLKNVVIFYLSNPSSVFKTMNKSIRVEGICKYKISRDDSIAYNDLYL